MARCELLTRPRFAADVQAIAGLGRAGDGLPHRAEGGTHDDVGRVLDGGAGEGADVRTQKEHRVADAEEPSVHRALPPQTIAVHERPVAAVQVAHPELFVGERHFGVTPREARIVELEPENVVPSEEARLARQGPGRQLRVRAREDEHQPRDGVGAGGRLGTPRLRRGLRAHPVEYGTSIRYQGGLAPRTEAPRLTA